MVQVVLAAQAVAPGVVRIVVADVASRSADTKPRNGEAHIAHQDSGHTSPFDACGLASVAAASAIPRVARQVGPTGGLACVRHQGRCTVGAQGAPGEWVGNRTGIARGVGHRHNGLSGFVPEHSRARSKNERSSKTDQRYPSLRHGL